MGRRLQALKQRLRNGRGNADIIVTVPDAQQPDEKSFKRFLTLNLETAARVSKAVLRLSSGSESFHKKVNEAKWAHENNVETANARTQIGDAATALAEASGVGTWADVRRFSQK